MDIKRKILKLLKDGYTQKQIALIMKSEDIKPNSLSIVEKYIKEIRKIYCAKTMFHLAIILIEQGYDFDNNEELIS